MSRNAHKARKQKGTSVAIQAEEATKKEIVTRTEDQIPDLEPYERSVFLGISYRELIIDILFVVFSFFISEEFFSNSGIFNSAKPWQVLAMYCVVVLTMPYYLGYVYVKNSAYYSKGVMKVFLWIFCLMTLMVLVYMMRLMFRLGDVENIQNDETGFFAVFACFLLVLGPMMCMGGAATAYSEFSKQNEEEVAFNSEKHATTMALVILVLAIGFMIYFMGMFPEKYSGIGAVASMFLGPFAAVIALAVFMMFLTLLSKIGIYKYMVRLAKNTFPFFIICVLVYWSGVSIHFMQSDFADHSGRLSWGAIIFSVVISGLIPFRLITMFNPPWRITNIVIGILSLAWFLYCMSGLTK